MKYKLFKIIFFIAFFLLLTLLNIGDINGVKADTICGGVRCDYDTCHPPEYPICSRATNPCNKYVCVGETCWTSPKGKCSTTCNQCDYSICQACSCEVPQNFSASIVSPAQNSVGVSRTVKLTFDANVGDGSETYWGDDTLKDKKNCGGCDGNAPNTFQVSYRKAGVGENWSDWFTTSSSEGHWGYEVSGLDECSVYYWKVRADNGCENVENPSIWSFRTNCAPTTDSLFPNSGKSGEISVDTLPLPCNDHNPQNFTITYSDSDGYGDLDKLYFWINEQGVNPSPFNLHSSIHGGLIKQSGYFSEMRGLECTSDCDNASNYAWTVEGQDAPYQGQSLCSPVQSDDHRDHNWDCAFLNTPGGWTVPKSVTSNGIRNCGMNPNCSGSVTVTWKVFFRDEGLGYNLDVMGVAYDAQGANRNWQDRGDWELDFEGPSVSVDGVFEDGDITVDYAASDSHSDIAYVQKECDLEGGACRLYSPNNPTDPIAVGNSTYSDTDIFPGLSEEETYTFNLLAWDEVCNANTGDSGEVGVPGAWIMSGLGDTFAGGGYLGRKMYQIKGNLENLVFGTGSDQSAYFSTYIISKGDGDYTGNRSSNYDYLLGNYDDSNANFYQSLTDTISENGCEPDAPLPSGGCSGEHVYLINSNITLPSAWLDQSRNSNRACVVIVDGNITIPAGTAKADGIDKIDAFLIANGRFNTNSDANNDSLLINGGVIARNFNLNRALTDNSENPAEVVRYDPKYLDSEVIRNCLGKKAPMQIREYRYSATEEE